jgi:hypothetical protein
VLKLPTLPSSNNVASARPGHWTSRWLCSLPSTLIAVAYETSARYLAYDALENRPDTGDGRRSVPCGRVKRQPPGSALTSTQDTRGQVGSVVNCLGLPEEAHL